MKKQTNNLQLASQFFLAVILCGTVFLIAVSHAQAKNSVCTKYDNYRSKYKDTANRKWYLKTLWLKRNDEVTYGRFKSIYISNKERSDSEIEKMEPQTKTAFDQFKGYKNYLKYLNYRKKCHSTKPPILATAAIAEVPKNQIGSFILSDPGGNSSMTGVIDQNNHAISFDPISNNGNYLCNNLYQLISTISLSPRATVDPSSGISQNYWWPIIFTVTGGDGQTQDYTVTVDSSSCPT